MPKYKHGKVQKTITREVLGQLMKRFEVVDRHGYSLEFLQSLLAMLYWSGFRISEVIGGLPHKVKHKGGIVAYTKAWPPLMKEQMWLDQPDVVTRLLYVRSAARKHGHREGPIQIPLTLDFVDLIVKQWWQTPERAPIWQIANVTWWRILKSVDPLLYSHFFILNRLTKQAEDPEISLKEQEDWSGKSPQTIASYRALAGRETKHAAQRMLHET
jgi:hypothetical protein